MTRKSIRERNAESIARAATAPETEPDQSSSQPASPPAAAAPARAAAEPVEPVEPVDVTGSTPTSLEELDELDEQESIAAAEKAAARNEARRQAAKAKADKERNLGVYMSADMYTSLKAAYLADWTNGRGEADTLYKWVAAALDTHSSRPPAQRAALASTGPYRAETLTGQTKAFKVPIHTWERMQEAIAADSATGRWLSDSRWSSEALRAAVDAARKANGGTLPKPPERLPNRLKGRGR